MLANSIWVLLMSTAIVPAKKIISTKSEVICSNNILYPGKLFWFVEFLINFAIEREREMSITNEFHIWIKFCWRAYTALQLSRIEKGCYFTMLKQQKPKVLLCLFIPYILINVRFSAVCLTCLCIWNRQMKYFILYTHIIQYFIDTNKSLELLHYLIW